MRRQNFPASGINLNLPGAFHIYTFKSQIKTADTRKQTAESHRHDLKSRPLIGTRCPSRKRLSR